MNANNYKRDVASDKRGMTILTQPSLFHGNPGFRKYINRKSLQTLVRMLRQFRERRYGGHPAVTRSLIEGLQSLDIPYNYNPMLSASIRQHCVVLSDVNALEQAIALKAKGQITYLAAGPNLFLMPSDMDGMIASPEVDVCLVPSQWIADIYMQDRPDLAGRIRIWPAGVNLATWPTNALSTAGKPPGKVLFYVKEAGLDLQVVEECASILASNGIEIERIYYGAYTQEEYISALQASDLCIVFTRSESQGIAIQEAWASNVPTWIWNPKKFYAPSGQVFEASSGPYVTAQTGQLFSSMEEFKTLLLSWQKIRSFYAPRQWVEQTMSDSLSANYLLDILFNDGDTK